MFRLLYSIKIIIASNIFYKIYFSLYLSNNSIPLILTMQLIQMQMNHIYSNIIGVYGLKFHRTISKPYRVDEPKLARIQIHD